MIVAALSLEDLPLPPWRYRVDRHSPRFETPADARREDRWRSNWLRKEAAKHSGEWGVRARQLADKLDPRLSSIIPRTPASARYMRRLRILVIGHLWRLVDKDKTGTIRRYDIVKPSWHVNIADLDDETAVRLKNELKSTLNRAGIPKTSGFIFAALHGDVRHDSEDFHPHYHLIASGQKGDVVDTLRKRRGFGVGRAERSTALVAQPVRKRHGEIYDVPYALGYLLKSYWSERTPKRYHPLTGKKLKSYHRRIREPLHSSHLLWLDAQTVDQLVMRVNIHLTKEGFTSE